MKYSIIIPTCTAWDKFLQPCLLSLAKYLDLSQDIEIIVVANGCPEGTKTFLDSVVGHELQYIWSDEPLGFTRAVNMGIKLAKGEYILFLNDDVVLLEQPKNHLLETFQSLWDSSPKPGVVGILWEEIFKRKFIAFYCAMTSRKVIDHIGMLDEAFDSGGEDIDFCIRAQIAGYRILALDSVYDQHGNKRYEVNFPIYHAGEGSLSMDPNLHLANLENSNKILQKRYRQMEYSIIIPTYNHCIDLLMPCIKSIQKYTDLSKDIEVFIVANGCTDETANYVTTLPQPFITLFFEEPLGFAKAVNEGIKEARGEYIVILNNDTELIEQPVGEWLRILREPLSEIGDKRKVGISGPLLGTEKIAGYEFLIFFCAMFWRRVMLEIGLLDESFPVGGGEDVDFCIRAQKADYRIVEVCPNPRNETGYATGGFPIIHKSGMTVNENKDWKQIFDKNMETVKEKHREDSFVGIVMPCYNAEKTIERAVESIKEQSFKEWVLIIFNDGSTDGTLKVLDRLLDHEQIMVINTEENGGPSKARNVCMDYIMTHTGATHIAFCDADDHWHPFHLQKTMERLKSINDCDIYCSVPKIYLENGQEASPIGIYPEESPEWDLMIQRNSMYISSVVMKIGVVKDLGGFEPKLDSIEDWEYWLRALKKGYKIVKGLDQTMNYMVNENGMAGRFKPEQMALLRVLYPVKSWIEEQEAKAYGRMTDNLAEAVMKESPTMSEPVFDVERIEKQRGWINEENPHAIYPLTEKDMIEKYRDKDGIIHEEIRLNLGCGDEILDGYINCDAFGEKADMIFDAKELPYPDNSIDEIRAYHLIEHFTYQTQFKVLREWFRALKPGGRLVMETPDLYHTAKLFAELYEKQDQRYINLYGHFFAWPDISPGQVHYFLFTESQMWWTLEECGFKQYMRLKPDSIYAQANPDWEMCYLKVEAFKPLSK